MQRLIPSQCMQRWVLYAMTLLALGVFAAPATAQETRQVEPNPAFGVIESYEAPEAATQLGAGWTRVRFQWAEVQPDGPDQWLTSQASEAQISAERAAGREIVGILIGIPDWARDENALPAGLYEPHDSAENLWANFVREMVTRYEGQIDHWIIWNEPDIWDKATPGHTWDGTEADFAQLMRTTWHVAKEANPDVVIHLAAMTFFWDNNFGRVQYLDRLLTELDTDPEAAENHYYFDVATAHLYFQPNQIYDILAVWRGILNAHGLGDKPWWLVETNAPVSDDDSWPVESVTLHVSQRDQANYMGQVAAVALSSNVERLAIFKLIDTESDRAANPEPFGLLRDDGSARPGFAAYQTVIDRLRDVSSAQRERWDELGQVRVDHTDGSQTHIVFSRNGFPQSAEIPARHANALLYDTFGDAQMISADADGMFRLELPKSDCTQPIADHCMIGGETWYLVQEAADAGQAVESEATVLVPTLAPTLTPEPTATAEPEATPTATPVPRTQPSNPSTATYLGASAALFAIIILLLTAFVMSRRYV